jgi:hypothetical protein
MTHKIKDPGECDVHEIVGDESGIGSQVGSICSNGGCMHGGCTAHVAQS